LRSESLQRLDRAQRTAVTTLPWAGATFRATTNGLAPMSLAVGVPGFRQISVPRSPARTRWR
jgi:hypothetical protein